MLDTRGQQLSLDEFIHRNLLQKGDLSKGIRANTLEAIIGAVWLDSGRDAVQFDCVMERMGLYSN